MEPQALCAARWPEKRGAYIKAVEDPIGTCNVGHLGSNIDFFMYERKLKHVMGDLEINMSIGPNPHRLVEVELKGRAHTFVGRYKVVPRNVPTKWFIGPRREPLVERWGQVRGSIDQVVEELRGKG